MKIETIKKKMKNWHDFYGGDLLGVSEIDKCETKEELREILDKHIRHMEMMLCDAISNAENFRKDIGLHLT